MSRIRTAWRHALSTGIVLWLAMLPHHVSADALNQLTQQEQFTNIFRQFGWGDLENIFKCLDRSNVMCCGTYTADACYNHRHLLRWRP